MNGKRKTACLFGGQGSQYIGMGKEYYDLDEDCRHIFRVAGEVMGYDLAELCFYGEKETFNQEMYSLPSMLAIDLCAFTLAIKQGFSFQALAGFSLGEYAALAAAEVVSIRHAFELVKLLITASNADSREDFYGMAAVNMQADRCENICASIQNGFVRVANYNSAKQVTIAGNSKGLQAFFSIASEINVKVIPIAVNHPFHCKLMESAAAIYEETIKHIPFADAAIPIYLNVTGEAETKAGVIKRKVVEQLYSPVLWTKTLEHMHRAGFEHFVECGLNSVLCRMVRETLGIEREHTEFLRTS